MARKRAHIQRTNTKSTIFKTRFGVDAAEISAVSYELADVAALQAIANGSANDLQQKRFWNWLIREGCLTNELGWTGDERSTSLLAGRQFVGRMLQSLAATDLVEVERRITGDTNGR